MLCGVSDAVIVQLQDVFARHVQVKRVVLLVRGRAGITSIVLILILPFFRIAESQENCMPILTKR